MSPGEQCYVTFAASLRRAGFVSGPWGAFADLPPMQQAAYDAAAVATWPDAQRLFYRGYPWMQHRLEALTTLLYPGKAAGGVVTLTGDALHEARALLQDLRAHLDRCYDPAQHTAFRRRQRSQHPDLDPAPGEEP